MRTLGWRLAAPWLVGTTAVLGIIGLVTAPAGAQTPPPGYTEIPGSPDATLNPAHVGADGYTFTQNCNVPTPPPPGGVVWHFVLPQADRLLPTASAPDNIFTSLTVTFRTAGTITITSFGPPSAAHAYITTPADDVLLSGQADGATLTPPIFPAHFNLSHTCASSQTIVTTTTTTVPNRGSFPITKTITGPAAGSQGPITFNIACSPPNGSIPSWVIPDGVSGVATTIVSGITVPAACVVTEANSGESQGIVVAAVGVRTGTPQIVQPVCPVSARLLGGPLGDVAFNNVVDTTPTTGPTTTGEGTTTTAATTTTTSGVLPTIFPPDPCPTLPATGPAPNPGAGALFGVTLATIGIALTIVVTRRRTAG